MYAIVQIGCSQYKVAEGETILVDRLQEKEGASLTLDKVLFLGGDKDVKIGKPFLKDVTLNAKVVEHILGAKTIAYKYRKRKDSAQKIGHRAQKTTLSILKINVK